jgi:hypothetical protein
MKTRVHSIAPGINPPTYGKKRALQRKSMLCIPFLGIVRPQSQFATFMCLWAIYIFLGSVHMFGCSKIDRLILEIYKSLTEI